MSKIGVYQPKIAKGNILQNHLKENQGEGFSSDITKFIFCVN